LAKRRGASGPPKSNQMHLLNEQMKSQSFSLQNHSVSPHRRWSEVSSGQGEVQISAVQLA